MDKLVVAQGGQQILWSGLGDSQVLSWAQNREQDVPSVCLRQLWACPCHSLRAPLQPSGQQTPLLEGLFTCGLGGGRGWGALPYNLAMWRLRPGEPFLSASLQRPAQVRCASPL